MCLSRDRLSPAESAVRPILSGSPSSTIRAARNCGLFTPERTLLPLEPASMTIPPSPPTRLATRTWLDGSTQVVPLAVPTPAARLFFVKPGMSLSTVPQARKFGASKAHSGDPRLLSLIVKATFLPRGPTSLRTLLTSQSHGLIPQALCSGIDTTNTPQPATTKL